MNIKLLGIIAYWSLAVATIITSIGVFLDITIKNILYEKLGSGVITSLIAYLSNLSWLFFPNQMNLLLWRIGFDQAASSSFVVILSIISFVFGKRYVEKLGLWKLISLYVVVSILSFAGTVVF